MSTLVMDSLINDNINSDNIVKPIISLKSTVVALYIFLQEAGKSGRIRKNILSIRLISTILLLL